MELSIKHHYSRNLIKDKEIVVEYCTSEDQIADIFTKPLKTNVFLKMKNMLGMIEPSLRRVLDEINLAFGFDQ
jgi:hypothetical protein